MIARLALMVKPRQSELMTFFLIVVGAVLAVGLLSLRYGVDSRIDEQSRR
jgi:hypothetical protein